MRTTLAMYNFNHSPAFFSVVEVWQRSVAKHGPGANTDVHTQTQQCIWPVETASLLPHLPSRVTVYNIGCALTLGMHQTSSQSHYEHNTSNLQIIHHQYHTQLIAQYVGFILRKCISHFTVAQHMGFLLFIIMMHSISATDHSIKFLYVQTNLQIRDCMHQSLFITVRTI